VNPPLAVHVAAQPLYREADCLDRRRWDDWLSLYTEDACYRIQTRLDEDTPDDDPDRCVSLIHDASRASARCKRSSGATSIGCARSADAG
jgi:3-phenylpropionate/cinnamic acid dioxygenase small subunit